MASTRFLPLNLTLKDDPPIFDAFKKAIEKNDSILFNELAEKLNPEERDKLIVAIMMEVMQTYSAEILNVFIKPKVWGKSSVLIITYFEANFMELCGNASENFLRILFYYLNDFRLQTLFNKNGDALWLLIHRCFEETTLYLLDKIRINLSSKCYLQKIFLHFSEEATLRFLSFFSSEELSDACIIKNEGNETALHSILIHQNPAVVLAFLDKISIKSLNECSISITNERTFPPKSSILTCGVLYQTAPVIAALLNKISIEFLDYLLGLSTNISYIFSEYVLYESSFYEDEKLLEKLFSNDYLKRELIPTCMTASEEGVELPPLVKKYIPLPHLEEKKAIKIEEKFHFDSLPITPLSFSELCLLPIEKKAEELWMRGMQSSEDYRHIQASKLSYEVKWVAKILKRADLHLKGATGIPYPADFDFKKIETIDSILKNNRLLLKTIKPKNMADFTGQIVNPHYRANIRREVDKSDEKKISHKFVHLQNQVIPYVPPLIKKNKVYQHTIKQPVSLESLDFKMLPFGSHHEQEEEKLSVSVGIYAEVKEGHHHDNGFGIIKGMFNTDLGTYNRNWIGTKSSVIEYAQQIRRHNYTDFLKFLEWVKQNPYRLNEMLVKLSAGSLRAIVIIKDAPEVRAIAREYHKLLRPHVNLPIVFRDRLNRRLCLYTKWEQDLDVKKISLTFFMEPSLYTKLNMMKIKMTERLHAYTAVLKKSIPGFETYEIWTKNKIRDYQFYFQNAVDLEKLDLTWKDFLKFETNKERLIILENGKLKLIKDLEVYEKKLSDLKEAFIIYDLSFSDITLLRKYIRNFLSALLKVSALRLLKEAEIKFTTEKIIWDEKIAFKINILDILKKLEPYVEFFVIKQLRITTLHLTILSEEFRQKIFVICEILKKFKSIEERLIVLIPSGFKGFFFGGGEKITTIQMEISKVKSKPNEPCELNHSINKLYEAEKIIKKSLQYYPAIYNEIYTDEKKEERVCSDLSKRV